MMIYDHIHSLNVTHINTVHSSYSIVVGVVVPAVAVALVLDTMQFRPYQFVSYHDHQNQLQQEQETTRGSLYYLSSIYKDCIFNMCTLHMWVEDE